MKDRLDIALRYFGIGYLFLLIIMIVIDKILLADFNIDVYIFFNQIDALLYWDSIISNSHGSLSTRDFDYAGDVSYFPLKAIFTLVILLGTRWFIFGKTFQR